MTSHLGVTDIKVVDDKQANHSYERITCERLCYKRKKGGMSEEIFYRVFRDLDGQVLWETRTFLKA